MTHQLLFLGSLGSQEIIIIALVILLLFGGKKIPELMRGLGKGVSQFKKGMKDVQADVEGEEQETVSEDETEARNENAEVKESIE